MTGTGGASLHEERELESLLEQMQERSRQDDHDLIAILVTNVNDSRQRYHAYGPEHQKNDRLTMGQTLVRIAARHRDCQHGDRLFYEGKYGHDMLVLSFTGGHQQLVGIAGEIKASIDGLRFEDHPKGKVQYQQDDVAIEHDPTRLTVRVGAAFQHGADAYTTGLLKAAIQASKDAKPLDGQMLIVEYKP